MYNKMKRTGLFIALLLVASLTTGCLNILKKTYNVEVTWDEEQGLVKLPENIKEIPKGTKITLEAVPNDGWFFKEWKSDQIPDSLKTKNPLEIVVNKNMKIEAVFTQDLVNLTVEFDEEQGAVEGIPELIFKGSVVRLKAVPKEGYRFGQWEGVPENQVNQDHVEIEVTEDMTIKVSFVEAPVNPIHETSFENDFDGWGLRGGLLVERTTEYYRTGNYSIKYVPNDAQGAWNGGARVDLFDVVEPGKKYYFSGWIYHNYDEVKQLTMQAQFNSSDKEGDQYHWIHTVQVPGGVWTKFEGTWEIPANLTTKMWLYWEVTEGSKLVEFYLDDVLVLEVQE